MVGTKKIIARAIDCIKYGYTVISITSPIAFWRVIVKRCMVALAVAYKDLHFSREDSI